jgi:hypothetical protein
MADSVDPTPVILARMEGKLDAALTEQARHTSTLDRHDATLNEHGNRLVELATTVAGLPRKAVTPAVVWTAVGLAIAALSALAALLAVR